MVWPQAQQISDEWYNENFKLESYKDLHIVIITPNKLYFLIGSTKYICEFENQRTAR
jgi:hypothetical protein